jgi:hypothetical protein
MTTAMSRLSPTLERVLASVARLQEVVPEAVLVGGSAAALHAGHRDSFDHYHVLADLVDRYEAVLEAVEATEGWATSVRASKPPLTIMCHPCSNPCRSSPENRWRNTSLGTRRERRGNSSLAIRKRPGQKGGNA